MVDRFRPLTHPHREGLTGGARLLCCAAALLLIAAGVVHVSAAADHTNLPLMLGGFLVVATAQVGLGALLLWRRPGGLVIAAALGLTGVALGTWFLSRTAGLPLLPGGHMEPIGFKDGVTVLFELAAIPALALLASREVTAVRLPSPRLGTQALAILGAGVFALFVPALVLGGGGHHSEEQMSAMGGGHAHGGEGHAEEGPELAQADEHDGHGGAGHGAGGSHTGEGGHANRGGGGHAGAHRSASSAAARMFGSAGHSTAGHHDGSSGAAVPSGGSPGGGSSEGHADNGSGGAHQRSGDEQGGHSGGGHDEHGAGKGEQESHDKGEQESHGKGHHRGGGKKGHEGKGHEEHAGGKGNGGHGGGKGHGGHEGGHAAGGAHAAGGHGGEEEEERPQGFSYEAPTPARDGKPAKGHALVFRQKADGATNGEHEHSSGPCEPSPEQKAAADKLYQDTSAELKKYENNPGRALADGFNWFFGPTDRIIHMISPQRVRSDTILEPGQIESFLYSVTDRGLVPIGGMYIMPKYGMHGPQPGGCLTKWHHHGGWVATVASGGTMDKTPEMLHVWTYPGLDPWGHYGSRELSQLSTPGGLIPSVCRDAGDANAGCVP